MAKFDRLHRARFHEFDPKEPMVILDFDDDWHFAIKLKQGMTKAEVARVLEEASRKIFQRSIEDGGRK